MKDIDVWLNSLNEAKRIALENFAYTFIAFKLAPLFKKYNVTWVGVPSYTPYFCDGDQCEYNAQIDCLQFSEEQPYDVEKEFTKVFAELPKSFFKNNFEEGLVVFKDDFTIKLEEYDHD
jgi:hypothetical protein